MTHKIYRAVACALIPAMTLGSLPLQAHAGIVGTEQALVTPAGQADRDRVSGFLAREDVRKELMAQGVNADDAIARVQAMSDVEVAQLAQRVDKAPAGAGVVGVLFTIFLILLVTDILGFTKVYPFTRPIR
ncbi:PA2779 family protein [Hydrogenophaga sp. R2]|uniref:PA2779 family protein n=1 Tax=Hydrogenophaga sp. R2 TaxID=3132827 RepID=UPI003CF20CFC